MKYLAIVGLLGIVACNSTVHNPCSNNPKRECVKETYECPTSIQVEGQSIPLEFMPTEMGTQIKGARCWYNGNDVTADIAAEKLQ